MAWERAGHLLACLLGGDLLLLFNAGPAEQPFILPPAPGGRWHRALDTGLPSPLDAAEPGREPPVEPGDRYRLGAHALAVLCAR